MSNFQIGNVLINVVRIDIGHVVFDERRVKNTLSFDYNQSKLLWKAKLLDFLSFCLGLNMSTCRTTNEANFIKCRC